LKRGYEASPDVIDGLGTSFGTNFQVETNVEHWARDVAAGVELSHGADSLLSHPVAVPGQTRRGRKANLDGSLNRRQNRRKWLSSARRQHYAEAIAPAWLPHHGQPTPGRACRAAAIDDQIAAERVAKE